MKVTKRLKRFLIVSFGSLYVAGSGYFLARLYLRRPAEFGDEPHVLERLLGPVHIGAALAFIFVMGILWDKHVRPAIRTRQHRVSGWMFIGLLVGLALTGITILYGSEGMIRVGEKTHPWIGVTMLPLILFHSFKKRKKS